MNQQAHTFEAQTTKTVRLNYLLFLPKGYGTDPEKRWALILFLHGIGERGNDLELIKKHGIPKIVEQQEDLPFITVSPQCGKDTVWTAEIEALNALLDEVMATYAVDTERIYVTGLSMGGFGTWHLAATFPDRFAAIAPMCGGGDTEKVGALKDVPVWAFHGAEDTTVPLSATQELVNVLEACGGNVRFTVYPDAGHDCWTRTYNNPELYEWFLQHRRQQSSLSPQV
jgi:predicted peptidase